MSNSDYDIDWAEIVDILAHEYCWTIDYIKTLDMCQITSLLKAIKIRYEKQASANTNSEGVSNPNKDLSISDFKAMGGKERIREDGRTEIVL